jgi:hypothetical protein
MIALLPQADKHDLKGRKDETGRKKLYKGYN